MPAPRAVASTGVQQGPSTSGSSLSHPHGPVQYVQNGFLQGAMPPVVAQSPYAPFVVQCGKCNTILADSFDQRVTNQPDQGSITLDDAIEDALVEARSLPSALSSSRAAEPRNEPDGQDAAGWFYRMACARCESIVARFYSTGAPAMSRLLNGRFSFERGQIRLHHLGSRRHNDGFDRRLNVPGIMQARMPPVHLAANPPATGVPSSAPGFSTFTPPPSHGHPVHLAAPSDLNPWEFNKLRHVVMNVIDTQERMAERLNRMENNGSPRQQPKPSPRQQDRSQPSSSDDELLADRIASSSSDLVPTRSQATRGKEVLAPPPPPPPPPSAARRRQSAANDRLSSSEVTVTGWKRRRMDETEPGPSRRGRAVDSATMERRDEEDVDSSIVTATTTAAAAAAAELAPQSPANASTAEEAPVKKKRGRPPKKRPTDVLAPHAAQVPVTAAVILDPEGTVSAQRTIKRRPGRPRKHPRPSDVGDSPAQQQQATAVGQAAAVPAFHHNPTPRLQPSVEVPATSTSRGRGRPSAA